MTRFLVGILVVAAGLVAGCGSTTVIVQQTPGPTVTVTASPTPSVTPVTLSPAITKYVLSVDAALQHIGEAWVHGKNFTIFRNEINSALSDINTAGAIEPANDGSKQWRLANRCGICVALALRYSVDSFNTLGTKPATSSKDANAAANWARFADSAMYAYVTYVKQVKAASPTASATPVSAKAAVGMYGAYGTKLLKALGAVGKALVAWPASETGPQAEKAAQPLIAALTACRTALTDYAWPSDATSDVHALTSAIGSMTGDLESIPSGGPFSSPSWGAKLSRDEKTVGAAFSLVGHDLGLKAAN